jgi:predicted DNA-binding WGR domain protein
MTSIHLERREPARNRWRFYAITVTRTLFDGWALVREWGRIGQPGTVRETWFETEGEAWEAGEQWRQRKEKRGYRAVGRFSKAGGKGGE